MRKHFTYISVIACIVLSGCVSDCYVAQKALMGMVFYNKADKSERVFPLLVVKGVGSDSLLYNGASSSRLFLPLKANADTTRFECSYTDVIDSVTSYTYPFTITVTHTPMPQLISEECGCVMFQTLNEVSFQGDVSATWETVIYNPEVTNVEEDIHVQIYIP